MSFDNLKRNRKSSISDLVEAAGQQSAKADTKSYKDERQWKASVDKAGNGYAVIRFLPAQNDGTPWVRYWDHGFKGPTGQWYIEKSLTSIGQQDPLSESNSKLWNSGDDADKDIARQRKRRLHYVSNILVESDPANPQNEGKVFLYTYGVKIHAKLIDAMQPEFQDEDPVNPFDFWEGASFKLKIRKVEGYTNYDKSEFTAPKALSEDETYLEGLYNGLYDLGEFEDPASYKTYDELSARLALVLGETTGGTIASQLSSERLSEEQSAPRSIPAADAPASSASDGDDDEGTMSFFAKLAQED